MKKIHIKLIEIILLLILALISDIKTYKIKNAITLPFIAAGFITNSFVYGLPGLRLSLFGVLLPFALLFILYALKMLGAGDIKLFCAIGSIMGTEFSLYLMAYSFIAGGLIACIAIIIRKNGLIRMKYLLGYLKTCLLTFTLQPYGEFQDKSDGSKFRFSFAVMCGTIIQLAIQDIQTAA